jgi:uncharacterized membrane protein (UPF0127 family)
MEKIVQVQNLTRPSVPSVRARYCASFLCQLRGLTFRQSLPDDEGLLLVQKSDSRLEAAIHMLAMWINLTVVWINSAGEVVDVRRALRWRLAYFPIRPARYVLELAETRWPDFQIGDQIRLEETPVA